MGIKNLSVEVRPTLFVASSSEGLKVAEEVKNQLKDYADITMWNGDMFLLNESYLSSLLNFSAFYDFAVMIFTADDVLESRGKKNKAPRDNVIFEYGLFLGRIGPRRTFILNQEGVRVLSDYDGITTLKFKDKDPESLTHSCNLIKKQLGYFEKDYTISLLPSTVLAIGYYKNFIEKIVDALVEKKPIKVIDKVDDKIVEKPIQYDQFNIQILLPNHLKELEPGSYKLKTQKFRRISLDTSFRAFPFYIEGQLQEDQQKLQLFDAPTTLLSSLWTIQRLFDDQFLKDDNHFEMLEQREIINFERTLRSEIKDRLEDVAISFGRLKD